MSKPVRVSIGDMELSMSRARAEQLVVSLKSQLDVDATRQPSEPGGGLVLPDGHPLWEQHTGLDGHRDYPEWGADSDLADAEAFYQPVRGKAKVFLDLLIDHPGRLLTVDDLCHLAGGDVFSGPRSIAGAINGLYRSHQASGRRYPFYWWEGRPTRYAMKLSVAELFRRARANLGL